MNPKRPAHRRRTPRLPKPPPLYTRQHRGLHTVALTNDVSYASLYRQHVTLGQPIEEAVAYCREQGLTYIPRGQPRLGQRRRKKSVATHTEMCI